MSDESPRNSMPDVTPIFRLVRSTRRLLRTSWVVTGLGLSLGLLLGALVLVAGCDLLMPPGPRVTLFDVLGIHLSVPGSALRLLGLLVVVVPASWAFVVGVVRPLLRRLALTTMARRIETYIPGIHNRLVSCIDLDQRQGAVRASPAFYRRLVDEALERARNFRPASVIDFLSLRRAGLFALGSTLALAVAWALFSDRLPTAVARIFQPFADIPPVTGVEYAVAPASAKVLRGEDVPFLVTVTRGDPGSLYLELYPDVSPRPLRFDLQKRDNDAWKFTLAGQLPEGIKKKFRYRVFGGGTWSKEYEVTLVERPKIASYHTVVLYPKYLGDPVARIGDPLKLDVAGPEESRLQVFVQTETGDRASAAESAAATGEIQLLESRRQRVEVKDRPERIWFDGQLPAGASSDGWKWDSARHARATHTDAPSPVEHRHYFNEAATGFQVQASENLFSYVYLVPENKPETIMLQWHDGTGWEHRAFWGADKIREGKAGTVSKHHVGELPPAGQWVRLEVPAKDVGLDGRVIRGMSFTLFGGQCYWHAAGAIGASHVERDQLVTVRTYPMKQVGADEWAGGFPLKGEGLYRIELKNALGHPNQTMKEGKFIAIKDNPPQVALERPGSDLVLSVPAKVPLVVLASDDFGLKEIALRVQTDGKGEFARQVVKSYATPARNDSVVANLDLVERGIKVGQFVRYHVEAVDRKGQVAKSQDFTVRIAADPSAADKQLEALEKKQDPFHDKLVKLIAEQAKVQEQVQKTEAKFAAANEKIQKAQADAKAAQEKAQSEQKDPKVIVPTPPIKLDAETEKQLAELRKELAKLAEQERKNTAASEELSKELKEMAEPAAGMKILPKEIASELKRLQQQFEQTATRPLQNLTDQLGKGADAKQAAPDVADLKDKADSIQRNLEALKDAHKAIAEAQKRLRDNPDDALAELRREMQKLKAGLTAREIEDLKKFIAQLQKDLKNAQDRQQGVMDETRKSPDDQVAAAEQKQSDVQKAIDDLLGKTKKLQDSDKMRNLKKRDDPQFPKAPGDPDVGEEKVRPREDDGEAPKKDKAATDDKSDKSISPKNKGKDEDDEKEFKPALGGPKPKVDPRYANKQRPAKPRKKDGSPEERRNDLEDRQQDNMENLDQAQKSLDSDKSTLDRLKDQLEQAMKPGKNGKGKPSGKESEGDQDLAELMKSQAVQQAMAMAQRAQQMKNSRGKGQQGTPQQANSTEGNLKGGPGNGPEDSDLSKLDLPTRMMLLKLQPKLREELLQGMREEGPEGYQKFVEAYFKRLTEDKK